MATELKILAWCDPCLEAGAHTPGEALTVPAVGQGDAFDVEACEKHAAAYMAAIEALRPFGRKVGTGVPKTPARASKGASSVPAAPSGDYPRACPVCGNVRPSMSAMRQHVSREHDKSLADVGLVPANVTCDVCGSGFPNGQGLAAHVRLTHPEAWQKRTA